MDLKDYSNLLRELEEGTCALILGPEFFLLQDNLSKQESIIESLRDTLYNKKLKDSSYIAEDGFFYTNKNSKSRDRKDILYGVKDFYRDLKVPDYYDAIAQLPFYMVISLSPDDLLAKSMNSQQKNYDFLYFKKGSGLYSYRSNESLSVMEMVPVEDITEVPKPQRPLLFNLLGLYEDTESLIFTYDSLFDFLYSIFPVENLPLNLRTAIQKASSFLFLGFGYDKWYLKIIFFTLEKILGGNETEKKAIFNYTEKQNKTVGFYENQFQFQFFKEGTVDFIKTLQNDCNEKGLIKKQKAPAATLTGKEKKYKILYFSSNPMDLNPLDFESEFKRIRKRLEPKENRDEFELPNWYPAATQNEIISLVNQNLPNVIVISMHGSKQSGLLFRNEHGEKQPLSLEEFLRDIRALTQNPLNRLECIIFSCCHTDEFARQVSPFVPYTIGMEGAIQDEAMPEFIEGFFDSLFNDRNIPYAYSMGKLFLEKNKILKENAGLVKLYTRP